MPPQRKPWQRDPHQKKVESLLGEIRDQLVQLNEGVGNMANEVVTQVNAKLDTIEQTLRDEAAEIQAAIEAAGAGGATPEELAALNARLDGLNTAIEALVVTPEA